MHKEKPSQATAQRRRRKHRIIAAACIFGSAAVLGFVVGGFWGNEPINTPVTPEDIQHPIPHPMVKRSIEGRFQALIDGKIELAEILSDVEYIDSFAPNPSVPPLSEPFPYGTQPIHGINLGGWLVLEPFIKPSMFKPFNEGIEKIPTPDITDRVVDEYTLTKKLGQEKSYILLKEHYETWVTEETFARIAKLGFDHVRIPIGFWAVKTWEGDPYVPKLSMGYFLQGLEWARKYGLRVNLDLHSAPTSQNGWNHSGRQGSIEWLEKGTTDSAQEISRILEILDVLSQIAVAPRYKNVIQIFGVLNEPRMAGMEINELMRFYDSAYKVGKWIGRVCRAKRRIAGRRINISYFKFSSERWL